MSSEIGKNLPPAENSAVDSPKIDSEFLAGRFMEEAQQTAPGEAFIMNPFTGETHKATVVTDLDEEAEEGGPGLRYLKPKPRPGEHEIAIRDYLAAKTEADEEADPAVLGYGPGIYPHRGMRPPPTFQKRYGTGSTWSLRPRGCYRSF